MSEELKSLFLQVHSDLLTPDFWREIQRQHESDEVPEVIPYFRPTMPDHGPRSHRLRR
jgi:isocitrate dehydrogenase kinase/phosphatase